MENERRVHKRRHLIYYLRVWDVDRGEPLGHLADLTADGFMLVSEQPIEVGCTYRLELQWQDDEGEEHSLRFPAESLWSNNDTNPAFYDTGFRLLEHGIGVLAPIQTMIDDLGFND